MKIECQKFIRENIASWHHLENPEEKYQIPTEDLQKLWELASKNPTDNNDLYSKQQEVIAEITKEAFLYRQEMELIENSRNLKDPELKEKILRLSFLQTGLEFEEPLLSSEIAKESRVNRIGQEIINRRSVEIKKMRSQSLDSRSNEQSPIPQEKDELQSYIGSLKTTQSSRSILSSKSKDNPFERKRKAEVNPRLTELKPSSLEDSFLLSSRKEVNLSEKSKMTSEEDFSFSK